MSTLPGPQAAALAQLVAERALNADLAPDPDGFLRKAQRIAARKGPWLALLRLHAPPQVTASVD